MDTPHITRIADLNARRAFPAKPYIVIPARPVEEFELPLKGEADAPCAHALTWTQVMGMAVLLGLIVIGVLSAWTLAGAQ